MPSTLLDSSEVAIGLAYSEYIPGLIAQHPELFDYVELPFELLRHDPAVLEKVGSKPMVLHCASLSVAGLVPPAPGLIEEVGQWIQSTGTPWLGEHFAFITADRSVAGRGAQEYAPGEPYNIGYAVNPPFNDATVARVGAACTRYADRFGRPVLVENSPIYFEVPGSEFSQGEAFHKLCDIAPVDILLDLAHFYISSRTCGFDPLLELRRWPLERVREIHISGVSEQEIGYWDDHATAAPEIEMKLLRIAAEKPNVRAVTLEYNWASHFPLRLLRKEVARARAVLRACDRRGA